MQGSRGKCKGIAQIHSDFLVVRGHDESHFLLGSIGTLNRMVV